MADAGKKKNTGFNMPAVVMIGLAVVIFVYALSLFLRGGFNHAYDLEYQAKVLNSEGGPEVAAKAAQKAILDEGYRWVDQANGKVGLPIEEAKELVVSRNQSQSQSESQSESQSQ